MNIEVKNLKSFNTSDGGAFHASVYINGSRVGTVSNGGYGGPNEYEPAGLFDLLSEHGKTLPPEPVGSFMMPISADVLIGRAMDALTRKQWARRQCAKKTLFRMPSDAPDTYRCINRPFDSSIKAEIEMRYGETVVFLNDSL